jgi:uncharacterized membrane protein
MNAEAVTRFGTDLPVPLLWVTALVFVSGVALALIELRRARKQKWLVFATNLLALASLTLAIVRPTRVTAKESVLGAKVLVLADQSLSMELTYAGAGRLAERNQVIEQLLQTRPDVRFETRGFGAQALASYTSLTAKDAKSDLGTAIEKVAESTTEPPKAIVVVSDGRVEVNAAAAAKLRVPIHTVAIGKDDPVDLSIRSVESSRVAVAHAPTPVRVRVGCSGGIKCSDLVVTAKELREDGSPALLATGSVSPGENGEATLELKLVLDRSGTRIVEFSVSAAAGDQIPENNRRLIPFVVTRERVRILHVAGQPTSDVSALRRWLKGNRALDVIAFFILRSTYDNPRASQDDLALIPFPVDELFHDHLPSFDAVVLQDFDAQPYGLTKHLPTLAKYVEAGGGLVMIGGSNAFTAGGYGNTPLARVLPVSFEKHGETETSEPFVARATPMGERIPLLGPLRALQLPALPPFPGANLVGSDPQSLVLWEHPTRKDAQGKNLPVLAIAEKGNGRSLALTVDGTYRLAFSEEGGRAAGRGYGALWDGLMGWLMRDPRFESADILMPGCIAGVPTQLKIRSALGPIAEAKVDVLSLDGARTKVFSTKTTGEGLTLPALPEGGYVLRADVGAGILARLDFACERGGDEWADPRLGAAKLAELAKATGGDAVGSEGLGRLTLPKATRVTSERSSQAWLPAWLLGALAALLAGIHWYVRRLYGFA